MSYIGELQANTAVDILIGPFVDDTDGKTAETALTIDVELSKNGQALANKNDATAPVHEGTGTIDGYYNCELDATDTNTEGQLTIVCFATGALPVRHDASVLSQAAWLSKYTAKDTGYLDVNVKAISEDTAAADNAESMFDGTGYAGGTARLKVDVDTLKTQAVTCGAGVTILASVGTAATSTAQTGDSYAIVNGASGLVNIKTDTAAIKTMTDKIGTVTNTGGTATIGAILGDFANTALVTRVADIKTQTGTAGAGLTAIPWNAAWDAEVQSECDDAITANAVILDLPTTAEFNARTLVAANYFDPAADTVIITRPTGAVATDGGNSTTVFKTTLSSAVDNFWNGAYLKITSGALLGQVRKISDYDGTNKIVTVDTAFTAIPADDVTFSLVNE